MPRSRWLVLLVAALLLLLGGANRGRVPAGEREGSRTADEPAARSIRAIDVDADDDHRSASQADGDRIVAPRTLAAPALALTVAAPRSTTAAPHVARLLDPASSPRGPPRLA
ncbi:MAG TPA: hypothetical protein VG755_11905 [Nannocystaceae bacterium]|nr:hypothetical protein [Nannocystaceae bacterium]